MAGSCRTCPSDGSRYCAQCQAYAQRAGLSLLEGPRARGGLTVDPTAPEAGLEAAVRTLCKATGHLFYHTYNSKRSAPGFPDWAIIHPEGGPLYLWEGKSHEGQVSPAQRRWLDALGKATQVETGVVRPSDWPLLQHLLTRKSP